MKLLNIGAARSIWLFNVEDVNPRGLDLIPVFATIQARYRFQKYPTKPEDIFPAPNGIQFGSGTFRLEDSQQIEIPSFTIYNDGLVADSRYSTVATDNFLKDLLMFISHNHRLTFEPQMVRSKEYFSEVVVSTELEVDSISEKFSRFATILSECATGSKFHTTALRFGTDPATQRLPLTFSFERKLGMPFERKRYFSQAPFETDRHLELLDKLEQIMGE